MTKTVTVIGVPDKWRPWGVLVDFQTDALFVNQADAEQWADVLRERYRPKWERRDQEASGVTRVGRPGARHSVAIYYATRDDYLSEPQAIELADHIVEWLTAKGWS